MRGAFGGGSRRAGLSRLATLEADGARTPPTPVAASSSSHEGLPPRSSRRTGLVLVTSGSSGRRVMTPRRRSVYDLDLSRAAESGRGATLVLVP